MSKHFDPIDETLRSVRAGGDAISKADVLPTGFEGNVDCITVSGSSDSSFGMQVDPFAARLLKARLHLR